MTAVPRFSLLTMIEAVELFKNRTQADMNELILRLDLEDYISTSLSLSKQNKGNAIVEFAKKNPTHQTVSGSNLCDELVEHAAKLIDPTYAQTWSASPWHVTFVRALGRDGFVLNEEGKILKTLPDEADLPQIENELQTLLDQLNLITAKGHLEQAMENHAQGKWASANSQLRSCLEGLFDEIAILVDPDDAEGVQSGHNRRKLLANTDPPFFNTQLNEWSP